MSDQCQVCGPNKQEAPTVLCAPCALSTESRRHWKTRFKGRVMVMEKLLVNAPDDNVPTPG